MLSKRPILDHVWGSTTSEVTTPSVQTSFSYLRRKVDAFDPPPIQTVPRVGYVVRLPETHALQPRELDG